MEVPSNIDEFLEVAKAFTFNDPDKNGSNDTVGFTLDFINSQEFIMSAFDLHQYGGSLFNVPDSDGEYRIPEKMKGYIPYLTFLRKMYTEKALEQEFYVNKVYDSENKFNQGKVGMVRMHGTGLYRALAPTPPEKMTLGLPFPNSKGERVLYMPLAVWGGWCITNQAQNVDKIMEFMNWAFSHEGILLVGLGIKGVHYETYDFEKRFITRTEEQSKLTAIELSPYMEFCRAYKGLCLYPEGIDTIENIERFNQQTKHFWDNANIIAVSTCGLIEENQFKTDNADLITKKESMEAKYVACEITLEEFVNFLETEYYPAVKTLEEAYIAAMKSKK
ncbi:MAG: extracellular solute-binding protein [Clostridiaceae bacterium]|nr:extracellular solute-binding protein [Clostridiaceae bacterium]